MTAAHRYNIAPGRGRISADLSLRSRGVPVPKIILDHVPPDVYARLQQLAAANQQSVAEEAVRQLKQLLPDPPFLTEEMPAPCTLPLPGPKVRVKAKTVPMWLPDPPDVPDEAE